MRLNISKRTAAFATAGIGIPVLATAANFALKLIHKITTEKPPQPMLLSVNIPPVSESEIAGVLVTRQGLRRYIENFQKRFDPRGKSYYWLIGEIIEDIEQPEDPNLPPHILTDVQAIRDRYITITPLQYNLTDAVIVKYLYQWSEWNQKLEAE